MLFRKIFGFVIAGIALLHTGAQAKINSAYMPERTQLRKEFTPPKTQADRERAARMLNEIMPLQQQIKPALSQTTAQQTTASILPTKKPVAKKKPTPATKKRGGISGFLANNITALLIGGISLAAAIGILTHYNVIKPKQWFDEIKAKAASI